MTMLAAIYARKSSTKQSETSVPDQLANGRARAAREGWPVAFERYDDAVSGATPFALRPGSRALLADALAGRFHVLIIESLDRTFRDVGEQEQIVKRLEHKGIRIIGLLDGYDTSQGKMRKISRIARGMVNELYLDDLRDKTHRGLKGQFGRGLSAGGKSYGYTTEAAASGRRLIIDEAQAVHVRWIFQRFAEGWSPVAIAHELNRRSVPSPRGGSWAVSAIQGSAARGLGLLNNEMYAGRVIWNRRQWIKDPETGKRSYVDRPAEEWQTREAPELRIVDAATWATTRQRIAGTAERGEAIATTKKGGRTPRTLFGGLLRCPDCGAPVIAVNASRYGCSVRKDRGPAACPNANTTPRLAVDTRLTTALREDLLAPDMLVEMQQEVRAGLASAAREARGSTEDATRRAASLDAEISRLVEAIATVGGSQALLQRLRAAEAERKALGAQLYRLPVENFDKLATGALAKYRALMVELKERLESEQDRERTRQLIRQVLGPLTLLKDADGVTWAEMTNPAEQLLAVGGDVSIRGCGGPQLSWRRIRILG